MSAVEQVISNVGVRIKEHRQSRGLTQEELARKAEIPYTTLTKIESGAIKNPSMQSVAKLADALGASLDDFALVQTFRGEHSLQRIWQDALETLPDGAEMCISGIDERMFIDHDREGLLRFIDELGRRGIRQKLLSREGDLFRLEGKHLEYRWIPEKFFNPVPIYVYGNKLCTIVWGPPEQVVMLNNPQLADAYRKQFYFMWEMALRS